VPPVTGPAYPAARSVAAAVEAHFAHHGSAAREQGVRGLAPAPDAAAIEAIIETAFWASLRREEGHAPKISLAFLPPEQAGEPLRFARTLPLVSDALTRLAPAVERPGVHLGVWRYDDELRVWGATRTLPAYCMVLEVVDPGLLVIKDRRGEEFGKFGNVAVLQGDQVKVVDEASASLPDCPSLLTALLAFDSPTSWGDPADVLVQLAASMRAHGRGGALLVVPAGSGEWRESMVRPIAYEVTPPFAKLTGLMRHPQDGRSDLAWQGAVLRAVDGIAGLTAVDGATVITDRYELLAFGAKITRRGGRPAVERLVTTEPVVGNVPSVAHPGAIGGTRHLSAAQFVHDQRDALALVASQDGRFTIFAWSPCAAMVHAHRVDALLL
jgi:hypothetical protein